MSQPAALVLVHGVGLDCSMWDLVVDDLAADRQVIRYDLLGHASSPDTPGDRKLGDFVAQLIDVLDHHGVGEVDLLGLSLGGLIALQSALDHPTRINRLMLCNTVHGRTDSQRAGAMQRLALTEQDGMAPVADLAIDRWFTRDWQAANPDRVEAVRTRLSTADPAGYVKAYRLFVETDIATADIARITAPTLVLTGELDVGSTPAMTDALATAIPNATAQVLPGLHHVPPIEAPPAFVDAVRAFLEESP